jgi:antitoxin component YwqK of YwqJK toxin-antitoxin module|tara:strand:- start:945 stop:1166 length:222 start_codon:yes stop_codon:yes gene_type:complete
LNISQTGEKSEGRYVSYHKNGEKFRAGSYGGHKGNSYDGKKEGVWSQYAEDGETVQNCVIYKHGKVIQRIGLK